MELSSVQIIKFSQVKTVKTGKVRKKNQEVILKAAEKEFIKHGFEGTSVKSIAEQANIPRANVHYYYKNKEAIYSDILSRILELWDDAIIESSDDPYLVLSEYIKAKVMFAKTNPDASRIFASEIIHGAPRLQEYLATDFKTWIDRVSSIIQTWIDQGKMDNIDPLHLMFCIWGSTQHYADFGIQVKAAMGKRTLSNRDFDNISKSLIHLILKGCGLIK